MAEDFDPSELLDRPVVAHVATSRPRVRPVWFLYEQHHLWWLTGPWSTQASEIADNPRISFVVDTCDLTTGEVRQVVAHGDAEEMPWDADRVRRKLTRYLGPDERSWDPRFQDTLEGVDDAFFLRVSPTRLVARDLSFASALS